MILDVSYMNEIHIVSLTQTKMNIKMKKKYM